MAKKAEPTGAIGPTHNTKQVVGPMDFPKGGTPEELAKAIGPNNLIGPNHIKSIIGPMNDTSGIELTVSSLNRVNVALLTDNNVVRLRCKVCGTVWVPILQEGKRLPPDWWSCPKDEKHSQKN